LNRDTQSTDRAAPARSAIQLTAGVLDFHLPQERELALLHRVFVSRASARSQPLRCASKLLVVHSAAPRPCACPSTPLRASSSAAEATRQYRGTHESNRVFAHGYFAAGATPKQ
jgi:hypothetical protein